MTNGDIEVKRVLEEAVSAALGPAAAVESVSTPAPDLEDQAARQDEAAAPGRDAAEGALGIQTSSWLDLAPLAAQGSGGGVSKAVSWLNPLLGGLLGLFGQDEAGAEAVPARAARAPKIRYEAGFAGQGGELMEIDRDEKGQARGAAQAPQVVVNIEAMDSRSFLDRTPEIAEAVKRALLESESIGRLMDGE